jgi:soluble lytic murein transglycosylase
MTTIIKIKCLGILCCLSFIICNGFVAFQPAPPSRQLVLKIDNILEIENAPLSNRLQRKIAHNIVLLSQEYALDPYLILAIIKTESHFDPQALSYAGAMGLMQVLPIVIRDVADDLPQFEEDPYETTLYDPIDNMKLGVHYFAELLKRFRNNYPIALTAYNMGPTAVAERIKQKHPLPQGYAQKVMHYYQLYKQTQTPQLTSI